MKSMYEANFTYDWSSSLSEIDVPTLILELAELGEVERYGYQGERIETLIPESSWVPVEGADDGNFYDAPEKVATPFHEFLEDHPDR